MGYEVDFLLVGEGSGDAICIRHGDDVNGYYVSLVDGGHSSTADKIITHIEKNYHGSDTVINHVVLSHADNDHARGLVEVVKHFTVRNLWMNRPWLYAADVLDSFHGNYELDGLIKYMRDTHEYLVELEGIAAEKGIVVREVFQGDLIGNFRVLAPSRPRYISLIPDLDKTPQSYADKKGIVKSIFETLASAIGKVAENWGYETLSDDPPTTSASNETSVVQLGTFPEGTILLTADVGPAGLAEAADYALSIGLLSPPSVVQIPHHGSRRNVTPTVLDRWLGLKLASSGEYRGAAICSVGSNKDDYPRKVVANAFIRRGYRVYSTKAASITHAVGMPERGWGSATSLAFSSEVEDYG